MRNVATVVFVFVAIGAAAQTLRSPNNAGAVVCLHMSNNPDVHQVFQTDILEPAGADRVRARFLVSNRCRVAVRVMGGLREDGSEIEQRGPIYVLALQDAPYRSGPAPVAGRASMPSFVVPANGQMEVDALIMLDGAVTPSEVAVAVAPRYAYRAAAVYRDVAYTRGGSRDVRYVIPDGSTGWCAHYEDRRCGEY